MVGTAVLVYENGCFKSFLADVKPPFTEAQMRWLMQRVPAQELMLTERLVLSSKGTISIENLSDKAITGDGNNTLIAMFCNFFLEKTSVGYKVSASDAGKIKNLGLKREEWLPLLTTYFDSENFLFKNKWSIANMVKYINELRIEAFGVVAPPKKTFPLPYDHLFFVKLDMTGQQEYWAYLRDNGYRWEANEGRSGKWVKIEDFK